LKNRPSGWKNSMTAETWIVALSRAFPADVGTYRYRFSRELSTNRRELVRVSALSVGCAPKIVDNARRNRAGRIESPSVNKFQNGRELLPSDVAG
jgi:hypothetical protein